MDYNMFQFNSAVGLDNEHLPLESLRFQKQFFYSFFSTVLD